LKKVPFGHPGQVDFPAKQEGNLVLASLMGECQASRLPTELGKMSDPSTVTIGTFTVKHYRGLHGEPHLNCYKCAKKLFFQLSAFTIKQLGAH